MAGKGNFEGGDAFSRHSDLWESAQIDQIVAEFNEADYDIVQKLRNEEMTELYTACQGVRDHLQRLKISAKQAVRQEFTFVGGYIRFASQPVAGSPLFWRLIANYREDEPGNVLRQQIRTTDYIMYLAGMTITRQTGVTPDNLDERGNSDRQTTGLPPLILQSNQGLYPFENSGYAVSLPAAQITDETPLAAIQEQRQSFKELNLALAHFPGAH